MSTFDAALGNYMAGLIDGEGCFLIVKKPNGSLGARFRMDLRSDDREVLDELRDATGLGVVKTKHSPSMQSPQVIWEIMRQEDCLKLVEILDACPLRAKKRVDYAHWREFVCWWTSRKAGSDWTRGEELRNNLIAGRRV